MSIAGNTTLIGGSDIGSHDFEELYGSASKNLKIPTSETTGLSVNSKRPRAPFATTDNSDIADGRPFFVKIEKDGVLAALRKLDQQLKSVSTVFVADRDSAHSSWREQTNGRNILSRKASDSIVLY